MRGDLSATKNETPKFARRDRAPNRELPARLCDTETEPPLAHAPCSRALGVKTIKPRKNKDWLAGAPGFEPPHQESCPIGSTAIVRRKRGEFLQELTRRMQGRELDHADLRREAATAMRAVLGRGHAWAPEDD